MNNSATVTARVPREVKRRADLVFKQLGITPTQVINDLYELILEREEYPIDALGRRHTLPKPGVRCLDKETIERFKSGTTEERERWEAFERLWNAPPVDWGEDTGKSYKEIIREGKRRDYEALSRH